MSKVWGRVRLGEVTKYVERPEFLIVGKNYRQIGVKLWGEGAYERETIDGGSTKYTKLFRAETDDIIVNKIWARNGSVAVVPQSLAGCFGSGEFPMYTPNPARLNPRWIHWLTKTRNLWAQCDEKSQGTSGKNRIKPERFLDIEIPLPPLAEQQRIVARIEEVATQINEVRSLQKAVEIEIQQMLLGTFQNITKRAPQKPMREVAPIVRRPVEVAPTTLYPELGIRSFGKGSFQKPALSGFEIGGKRIFKIEPGDLLFSNVFAWEGAIAVAKREDTGRFGSHRFISCIAKKGEATAQFLCFYFLTNKGMELIRAASPGGAGRNRTLGLEALANITVPIPQYETQIWFDTLQEEIDRLKQMQAETAVELDALLPAILDRAFKGEL